MKKFLVTGGDGFIGSAVCEMLLNAGINVVSLDNRSRSRKFTKKKLYKSINCDLTNLKELERIKENFDSIIHLAFVNGTKFFYEKPEEVIRVGLIGTYNIIKFAEKKKISNFYISSSSEVYQTPYKIPTDENEMMKVPDAYNPRFSYGGSKILTELMSIHMGKNVFKKMIIFRPHNVYGPNMGNEHVIPEIINKIKHAVKYKKKFINIQGTGNETRSFNYIKDFTGGVELLIKKKLKFSTYNIGNDKEIKISQLVEKIMKMMNVKLQIKYQDLAKGSTLRRCPNINKIRKLGYRINNSIDEGLKKTIAWYLKN